MNTNPKKKIDLNLVPENVKNIAWRANGNNPHTNATEKMVARSQLDTIVEYCNNAILDTKFQKR